MTNKEKYKRAFSGVQPREAFLTEVSNMENTKKKRSPMKIAASALAACLLVAALSVTAYAADLGGIQRTLQLWIRGDQTQVTVEYDGNGGYDMNYTDENGEAQHVSGGGVSLEDDGTERPLTPEELEEMLLEPSPEMVEENGRTYIWWMGIKTDITDKFADGVCYIHLKNGRDSLYVTAVEGQYISSSPHYFLDP